MQTCWKFTLGKTPLSPHPPSWSQQRALCPALFSFPQEIPLVSFASHMSEQSGASYMIEQRQGLGDACMLMVPAEYAGARSGSGDHPQQYYLHCPKLTTFEEKDFFSDFFYCQKNNFYRDSRI